jgi:glucokinase
MKKLLVGDIGGTNTFLGISDSDKLLKVKEFKTKDISIEDELNNFLLEDNISGICIGVAGPVIDGNIKLSNVDKSLSSKKLSLSTGLDVLLINDFEAIGYFLKKMGFDNSIAVGAGTGLGRVSVFNKVLSGESGGEDFPFFSSEDNIRDFFSKKLKRHPRYEDLVSGKGIIALKEYHLKKKLSAKDAHPSMIFIKKDDIINKKTISDFARFYGRFVKNCALDSLPDNIFIAGGIARKNPWIIDLDEFRAELKDLPKNPRISLINDKYAGMKGAVFAFSHKNI